MAAKASHRAAGAGTGKLSVAAATNGHNNRKRKAQKNAFIYGNYTRYYGYRIGELLDEDPRLKVLRKEWFEGKDCLDIGCNEGYVTITIAQKFGCKSILGVDIDATLVCKARRHLKNEVEGESGTDTGASDPGPTGEEPEHIKDRVDRTTGPQTASTAALSGEQLAQAVSFRRENFIETPAHEGLYDTVLCLSVTKWIHLNWGDEGLIQFFAKIHRVLRPGGMLVVEPQPWSSYAKKRRVSEVCKKNFKEIQLRPDNFPELLIDKIGFKSYEQIASGVKDSIAGFNRPLFLYYKATEELVKQLHQEDAQWMKELASVQCGDSD